MKPPVILILAVVCALCFQGCSPEPAEKPSAAVPLPESTGVEGSASSIGDATGQSEALISQIRALANSFEEMARSKSDEWKPAIDGVSSKTMNDLKALSQWEYKTERLPLEDIAASEALNAAGKEGWELVAVTPADGGPVDGGPLVIYKRRPPSVFRNIPARDLLRLLPLLQQ